MLIAVVSDTHGQIAPAVKTLQCFQPELLLFLGDFYADGQEIITELKIPGHLVAGNGDWLEEATQREKLIVLDGVRFFLTHGHTLGVKQGVAKLEAKARKRKAQIVLYGHTHRSYLQRHDTCWLMNPGSASQSRDQQDPSIGLINLSPKQAEFSILSVVDQSLINGDVWRWD